MHLDLRESTILVDGLFIAFCILKADSATITARDQFFCESYITEVNFYELNAPIIEVQSGTKFSIDKLTTNSFDCYFDTVIAREVHVRDTLNDPFAPTGMIGTVAIIGNIYLEAEGETKLFWNKLTADTMYVDSIVSVITRDNIGSPDTTFINNAILFNTNAANTLTIYGSSPQSVISLPNLQYCLDYLSFRNINLIGTTQFYAGTNGVDLGGNTGIHFSICPSSADNVWPGDANYDLTANNTDVLSIGLAYGVTGPVRASASNAWVAQPGTFWGNNFASGFDYMHADCDGNGLIDNNDTLAISLNYGLLHPARFVNPETNNSVAPQVYLVANPDTVSEGDTVQVDIFLGTQSIPVDSIYGIAFSINVDPTLIDTTYMPFDFSGSWLGTPGTDLLTYDKKLFSQNKADVALTRIDHASTNGYGYVGKFKMVIANPVTGHTTSNPPFVTCPLSVSSITALTASEYHISITGGATTVEVDTIGNTGIAEQQLENMISVYPNPVKDVLKVNSGTVKIYSIEINNQLGQLIMRDEITSSTILLNIQNLHDGIYFLKITTDAGVANKKFFKTGE